MPPHLHYVEPYFGGGAVLFRRTLKDWFASCPECKTYPAVIRNLMNKTGYRCVTCGTEFTLPSHHKGCSEVVNDINCELMNFWDVLKNPSHFTAMQEQLETTPFSEQTWERSCCPSLEIPVNTAVQFFVRYRQSRQGLGKDFATMSRTRTRRRMNEQVSSWLSAVEGLPEAHERLKRVVILNRPALDVIKQQDGEKTLFYLDPPYLHETRSSSGEYGEHEMSEQDHAKLLLAITGIKGKFLLSGYHSKLYDNHATQNGWRCEEKKIDNKASSKAEKQIKTECLWMNY